MLLESYTPYTTIKCKLFYKVAIPQVNLYSYKKEIYDLWLYRWVTISTVSSNLKVRYKRSVLGFFWSLIGPIISYGTIAFVFFHGMKVTIPNYFSYFFPAVILYSFMNTSMAQAGSSLIMNEHFIKKIYLPKIIFPINSLITEVVTLTLNLTAIFSLGVITGKVDLTWRLLLLPVYLIPTIFFTLGAGLTFAVASVFFRDLIHVIPLLMQAAFYLTPILYDPSILPSNLAPILKFNPLTYYVEGIRVPFNTATFSISNLIMIYALGLVTLIIGVVTIKKVENKIVFKL